VYLSAVVAREFLNSRTVLGSATKMRKPVRHSDENSPNSLVEASRSATNFANLDAYMHDRYIEAVAEVARLDEEDDFTHRMRVITYLHLTRFVRILLDRKDRMSMAVGLEVRVPFCDHRLVEYVYNTPWSLKSYDGREKSLLRGATRDVLPESVVQRVKSPYPSTSDPNYVAALQEQTKDVLATDNDVLFGLLNRVAVDELTRLDPRTISPVDRIQLQRTLDLSVWIDIYNPDIVI
jgi:asparagine synthase (glutamine-hydrolysing)